MTGVVLCVYVRLALLGTKKIEENHEGVYWPIDPN